MKDENDIKRILDLSAEIAAKPARDAKALTFMARRFVQTTLPHRDPGDIPEWHRKNGNLILSIRPGWREDPKTGEQKPIGIPYGSIPRLLLFWITTESLKTGKRLLDLGPSFSHFIRALGLDPSRRGKNSTAERIKDQLLRLLYANISFEEKIQNPDGTTSHNFLNLQIASHGHLKWFPEYDGLLRRDVANLPHEMEGSWIYLSDVFFESVMQSSVPLDMRMIKELKTSPLALDLYAWMTHRTYKNLAQSSRLKPSFVSWKQLHGQFGSDYADIANFKKKVKPILKIIQALSLNVWLECIDGGIQISQKLSRIK